MKLKRTFSLLLCAMLASVLPLAGQSASQSAAAVAPYVLQPNDVISVFVFNHVELSLKVTIQPDGLISIPLVQSIQAAGLTPAQLKVNLEKVLEDGKLISVPSVTVTLDAIQSYRIYIIGKVQKPGLLAFEKPVTVLQALAMAGGFQDYAKKKEIAIVRTSAPKGSTPQVEKQFKFNYEEVLKGANQAQNIYLESGDVVVIQ